MLFKCRRHGEICVVYLQDMVTVVRKRLQRFMLFSEVLSSSTVGKKESLEQ